MCVSDQPGRYRRSSSGVGSCRRDMRTLRFLVRRTTLVVTAVIVLVTGLFAVPPNAHALTGCGPGCAVTAHEDDYSVAYRAGGLTLSDDAAHGLLANDAGPLTTR